VTTQYIIDRRHFTDRRTAQSVAEKMLQGDMTVTVCVMSEPTVNIEDLEYRDVQMEMFEHDEIAEASSLRGSAKAVTLVQMKSGKFAVYNRDGLCGIYEPDHREVQHSAGPVDVYEFIDWPPPCWNSPKK
jgi:hypothetical protein